MSNSFYTHGAFPSTGSAATSASMRAELDLISAGFDKMPTLSGNANLFVVINSTGTGLTQTSTLPSATFTDTLFTIQDDGDNTRKFQFNASTVTPGATRIYSVPDANTTLVGTDTTQTLTNKTLTAPVISSIVNTGSLSLPTSTDTLVGRATTDTLTNKTLTSPVIATIVNTGTLTLPTSTDTLVGRATTDTLTNKTLTSPVIATIVNTGTLTLPTSTDTLVGRATTDTLTNKTLTSPVIGTIVNTGTLTLPTSTDTLVGRATTDTLTNKTLTSPVIATIVNTGTLTLPTSTDTLVGRATTDTLTNKTLGAFTISGTVSGGGNQINNVIIGASTPLAGSFTTLSTTGLASLPSTGRSAAAALTVTNPAFLYGVASTYTDTASSGVIAAMAPFYSISGPTLSTSNVTTYTNSATLYIANAPTAGGSATITNPYAVYVAAGAAYFGGAVTFAGSASLAGLTVTSLTNSGLTTGCVVYTTTGGLETSSANLTFNGTTLTANTIGAFTLSGTVAGGGNQINNVIIGTSTPLAGAFTTLSTTGKFTGGGNIQVAAAGDLTWGGNYGAGIPVINGTSGTGFTFYPNGSTSGAVAVLNASGLTITGSLSTTGSAGIGTSSPTYRLSVKQSGNTSTASLGIASINSANDTFIGMGYDSTSDTNRIYASYVSTGAFKPISFWTSDIERVRIDSSGNVLVATNTLRTNYSSGAQTPVFQIEKAADVRASITRDTNDSSSAVIYFGKTRGTTVNSNTVVADGDNLGLLAFEGADGTNLIRAASISAQVDGAPSANDMPGRLLFSTTPDGGTAAVERMRIDASGNVLIGSATVATNTLRYLDVYNTDTGASAGAIIRLVTSNAAASGNTTVDLVKYKIGGFILNNNDTNTAAFTAFGVGASERMRIDSAGNVGIGSTQVSGLSLRISKGMTPGTDSGASDAYGVRVDGTIAATATNAVRLYSSYPSTVASAFTLGTLSHYQANGGTVGAGSAITSQYGFQADSGLVGATNNYGFLANDIGGASATTGKSNFGFYSALSTASGGGSAWNIYVNGTASNYFAGKVGIGTNSPGDKLEVTSSTQNIVVSRSTGSYAAFQRIAPTGQQAYDFYTINSVEVARITGDPSYLAFSTGSAATERMRIDSSGNVLVTSAAGLGYGTGSGGTVTQATSKSTAVTLNKPTGRITTAADALSSNTTVAFTFTNSLIAATDNILFTFSDGNGYQYNVWAYNVLAGSCTVALRNITAGSLSQALPINFAIIKGATS